MQFNFCIPQFTPTHPSIPHLPLCTALIRFQHRRLLHLPIFPNIKAAHHISATMNRGFSQAFGRAFRTATNQSTRSHFKTSTPTTSQFRFNSSTTRQTTQQEAIQVGRTQQSQQQSTRSQFNRNAQNEMKSESTQGSKGQFKGERFVAGQVSRTITNALTQYSKYGALALAGSDLYLLWNFAQKDDDV